MICKIYIFPAIIVVLAGCSNLDFSRGPMEKMGDVIDSGKPFTKENNKAVEKAKYERLTQLLAEWQRQRTSAPEEDYLVGADDVLDIEIVSIEQPGVTSKLSRTVDKEGKITLPLINRVKVSGLRELDVKARIAAAYGGRYLKDPEVTVKVKEYKSAEIVVTGAVQKPGVCYLQRNIVSVLDVLSMAGGLSATAGDNLYISRSLSADVQNPGASNSVEKAGVQKSELPKVIDAVVPQSVLSELAGRLAKIKNELVVPAQSNNAEQVKAPGKVDGYVYVLGYVNSQRKVPIAKGTAMKALGALTAAGGAVGEGKIEKTFVVRTTNKGDKRITAVDLSLVEAGLSRDIDLQPGDTLVVASDALMNWLADATAGLPGVQPEESGKVAISGTVVAGKGSVPPEQTSVPDMFMPQRLKVDLRQLIDEGDVRQNVAVKNGDIVTIPPKVEQYVYVLGYVQRPGPIVLKSEQSLKALNALAMVGGLTYQGRAEKSYLIRDTENDRKVIIDVDLGKVARGVRPDVDLRSGDTLVVGSGFFMKMAEIIRPTVSAGASVSAIP